MPENKITKLSKADADIARNEFLAIIAEEAKLGTKYFEDTYNLHVRAGRAYWNAFLAVCGDDNAKPETTKFADINTALGVDADKAFLGIRKLPTLSEDFIAFRANSVQSNAFMVANVEFKANGGNGKGKTIATSFRDIAPALRVIGGGKGTSNRKGSDDAIAAAKAMADNKVTAWNYGYLGSFSGADDDGNALQWSTAQKNLVRGLINRSGVDMALLRSIAKDDVELVRALMNGVLDDVKRNGPTVRKDIDADIPDVAAKTKRTTKSK